MSAEVFLTRESSGEQLAEGFEAVNAMLEGTGVRVMPKPLEHEPPEILALLSKSELTEDENARLKAHFLLPRAQCLEIIAAAGRIPQVDGGGSMEAFHEGLDIQYPQLWVIEEGADYSDFYPYHRNTSDDGVGSDELSQILSGEGMGYRYDTLGGVVLTTKTSPSEGVLVTFSGILPHAGPVNGVSAGSKVLVQVLGPERFRSRAVE